MRVTRSKVAVISDLIIDADLDLSGDYQITNLASPAEDEALRKGERDITTAEISLTANILATQIANTAMTRALMTAQGDMITRSGTIPKKLVKGTDGQFLKIGANEPEWATIPSPLTVVETEVFSGNTPASAAWTDLDLSGTVGANVALVILKFYITVTAKQIAFRKNGDTDEFYGAAPASSGCALGEMTTGIFGVFMVATDAAGKIEWMCEDLNEAVTIDIIAFIK